MKPSWLASMFRTGSARRRYPGAQMPSPRIRGVKWSLTWALVVGLAAVTCIAAEGSRPAQTLFEQGNLAFQEADYLQAAALFRKSAGGAPASGTLHNLGTCEWMLGHTGPAVLAWERALWVDPQNELARASLRLARQRAELQEPSLTWFEVCSTWLPFNTWPWVTAVSLWFCVAGLIWPVLFRPAKGDWPRVLAIAAFAVLLLSIPATLGIHSRSRLGFILPKDAPLRLTPTHDAEILAVLPSGEGARLERQRADFVFVRLRHLAGWVKQSEFESIADPRYR